MSDWIFQSLPNATATFSCLVSDGQSSSIVGWHRMVQGGTGHTQPWNNERPKTCTRSLAVFFTLKHCIPEFLGTLHNKSTPCPGRHAPTPIRPVWTLRKHPWPMDFEPCLRLSVFYRIHEKEYTLQWNFVVRTLMHGINCESCEFSCKNLSRMKWSSDGGRSIHWRFILSTHFTCRRASIEVEI